MLGLFLTALLTRFRVRGFMFFRTVLFMPQTIATVVVAQAFVWIYDPTGPLNEFLRAVGLGFMAKSWLGDFEWALPAVGLIGTWITFGLCLVLFLAGAQRIPQELYEAARVDGAGFVREFFAVTLPGLRNEIVVAATLTTITALRNFDIIYNVTAGGPGRRDLGAVVAHVPQRVRPQPRGLRRLDRGHPDDHHHRDRARHRPALEARDVTGRFDRYTTYVVLIGFSLLALYPMISILFLAFHRKTDLVTGFSLPTTFSFETFRSAWTEGDFAKGMWGSILVATTVTVVSAVLSLFTGYAFGTMRFRGSGLLFNLIVVGLIFPYEATVIPLYYDFLNYNPAGINLAGTYWALILPQIGQSVTLGTFWMRAFFLSTPKALVEAGRIDGAGTFRILRSILLPQAPPGAAHALPARLHVHVERVPARARAARRLGEHDRAARALVLRGRRARVGSDQGRGRVRDRGAPRRGHLPLPAAPLHPRRARGRDQGIGLSPRGGRPGRRARRRRRSPAAATRPAPRRWAAGSACAAGSRACAGPRR